MKRFLQRGRKRVIVAVLVVASLGVATMAQAAPAGKVRFRSTAETWDVIADGEVVSTYDNALEARAGASERKLTDPSADVRVRHEEEYRAVLPKRPATTTTTALDVSTTTGGTTDSTTDPTTTDPTPTTASTTSSTTSAPTTAPTTTPPTTSATSTTVGEPVGPLVLGLDASPPASSWRRPALNSPYTDAAYGLSVRRLTSADGTRFNRNVYSRRQAENADGRYFFSYHGSASYRVYGADGSQVAVLDMHPDAEPQWHPTDPHIVRHTAGSNSSVGELRLYETDVTTGRTTVVADLTDQVRRVMPTAHYLSDGAEGSPSADGDRYAWMVLDQSQKLVGLIAYDLSDDRLLGWRDNLSADQRSSLDAISMSPSGNHVVAQYLGGTVSYDAKLANPKTILAGAEHSDTMLGADGSDYYVYIDFVGSSPHAGWAVAHNLRTGVKTRLFDLYDDANTSIHFSGKAFDEPGWVVASTYNCKEATITWSCNKVFAVNIHDGTVVNLAHTYNCGDNYWTETHASVNRSLSRVYFNSDSGSCGTDAEIFRIDVPKLPAKSGTSR